jgi:methionyl-tRNA synthetase
VIGKDILIPPHGIYWPIMLHACGFSDEEIPTLLVHGWWNIGGAKMSKSLGNIVEPEVLADTFGVAATRYYLLSDIATGRDADFSEERLVQRYNTDLANSLGNLLNRSLSMAKRYRAGIVRKPTDAPLASFIAEKVADFTRRMDAYETHAAIESAWEIIVRCNAYVEESAPWKLAKDPESADRLDEVLYTLAEALRIISLLITPFLPAPAAEIRSQLAWKGSLLLEECAWGGLSDGHQLGDPVPVFPRIETP